MATNAHDILKGIDLEDVVLDALCDSDSGNNPFYRDDNDTVSLAYEVAAAVRSAIQAAHKGAPHTASGTSARITRAEGPGRHPRQVPSPLEPAGEPDPETLP